MSTAALKWSRTVRPSLASTKAVLFVLCDHANDNNEAFLKLRTIVAESRASRRTVISALADLRQHGCVTWIQRHHNHGGLRENLYTIHVERGWCDHCPRLVRPLHLY